MAVKTSQKPFSWSSLRAKLSLKSRKNSPKVSNEPATTPIYHQYGEANKRNPGGKSKGVNLIVVGAGYAGLTVAIDCAQNGAKVKVFESVKELTNQGDSIQLGPNATRLMDRWGNLLPTALKFAATPETMQMFDKNGKLLLEQPLPLEYQGHPMLYCSRGRVQRFMYDYAVSLGVEFNFNCRIKHYFEEDDCAGIFVGDQKYVADGVIATDGIHSKAQPFVTGISGKPKSSGFAIYRAWFSMDALEGDPRIKKIVDSKKDLFFTWIGEDTHVIFTTNVNLRTCVVFATHKDSYAVEESWSFPGSIPEMLKSVEGWDEQMIAIMEKVPPEILIDWKLLWRDPVKKWVSDKSRIVLAGDSAHPHLATSGQGSAQAIEDGATLAAVIDCAGRENLPLAFQAFAKLRYMRTNLTQRLGWETRHKWHQTDWEAIKSNPDLLKMPFPDWLFSIDARDYAYENYDAVTKHIEKGAPFNSTNVPKGYVHKEWTIDTMMNMEKGRSKDEYYVVN